MDLRVHYYQNVDETKHKNLDINDKCSSSGIVTKALEVELWRDLTMVQKSTVAN